MLSSFTSIEPGRDILSSSNPVFTTPLPLVWDAPDPGRSIDEDDNGRELDDAGLDPVPVVCPIEAVEILLGVPELFCLAFSVTILNG